MILFGGGAQLEVGNCGFLRSDGNALVAAIGLNMHLGGWWLRRKGAGAGGGGELLLLV